MSCTRPYMVPDDEDDDYDNNDSDSDLELLDFDSDCSEPEIIVVSSRSSTSNSKRVAGIRAKDDIRLPNITLQRYTLSKGNTVRPGDTVELQDRSSQQENRMHSGDFLRIRFIIKDMQTGIVRLRGLRMRRTKYLGQIFDWKMNELAMVLHVSEDEDCPFVAGMEDAIVDDILRVRECSLTNKPYPFLSFREGGRVAFPLGMSEEEMRYQIFQGGRLCCRVVNILFLNSAGKSYSGIVRHLYARESDAIEAPKPGHIPKAGLSRETSISIEEEDDCIIVSNGNSARKRRARSNSIEMLEAEPPKRKSPHPHKKGRLTFGDVFCGPGGASQGAAPAGYYVQWGLDNDETAIESYRRNHRSGYAFQCDAHDFPPSNVRKQDLRVDVLHLSPPCCFWSQALTREGANDQANFEAIYTVGPILKAVKSRVATLEQTFGLVTHTQHKKNFLMLLNDIGRAGYDVRYKIQDLSKHGLVQKRKRLLMIATRRGTPLPPFPKPTHGPPGSGLQPFVYINEALTPLERQGRRIRDDPYHQQKYFAEPKPAYNPHSFLKGCITTSGSDSYHYSGDRGWTPRELALFQTFPYIYHFMGTKTEVTKQIGNAFPPVMAEAMYRTIAKTLEAFDEGLIGAGDDLSELDTLIRDRMAVRTLQGQSAPRTPIKSPTRNHMRDNESSYSRVTGSGSSRSGAAFPSMNLLEGVLDGIDRFPQRDRQISSGRRGSIMIEDDDDSVINIPSDSD